MNESFMVTQVEGLHDSKADGLKPKKRLDDTHSLSFDYQLTNV